MPYILEGLNGLDLLLAVGVALTSAVLLADVYGTRIGVTR